jgi:hypothetical protein
MDGFSFGVLALASALSVSAATPPVSETSAAVPAPAFKTGDAWVFEKTTEKGQGGFSTERYDLLLERLDGDTMVIGAKPDGAPTGYKDRIVGTDWSRRLVVNGQETVTNRPFVFPMNVGQTCTVDGSDSTRRGNLLSAHVHKTCSVTGWEDVAVPAGTFHALKIVCKGVEELQVEVPAQAVGGVVAGSGGSTSVAHAQKGGRGTVTHVIYGEIYYAPETRDYVKAVDETYNSDDVRLGRVTDVLASFKPGS